MRWQICEFVFVCCMIQLVSCIENNSTSTTNDNLLSEETKERIRQEVLRDLNTKLKKQQEENFRVDVQRQQHIRQENLPMEQSTLASVIAAAVPVVAAAPVPLVSVATAPAPLISQRPVPQGRADDMDSLMASFANLLQPKIMGADSNGKLAPLSLNQNQLSTAPVQTIPNANMVPLSSQPIPNQQQPFLPQNQFQQQPIQQPLGQPMMNAPLGGQPTMNSNNMDPRMMGYGSLSPMGQGAQQPLGRNMQEQLTLPNGQVVPVGRDLNGNPYPLNQPMQPLQNFNYAGR